MQSSPLLLDWGWREGAENSEHSPLFRTQALEYFPRETPLGFYPGLETCCDIQQ